MQKLAKKFIDVMTDCSHIAKNGKNNFHNYKYATSADVLEKVNNALTKNGIASIVTSELIKLENVQTAKGNIEHLATVKIEVTLIDKDSGEMFKFTGLGSGQDSGDKAVMKAQTAAIKYAYLLSLAISTGDDPEEDIATDKAQVSKISNDKNESIKSNSTTNKIETFCHNCNSKISARVAEFSQKAYGISLCMNCQKSYPKSA